MTKFSKVLGIFFNLFIRGLKNFGYICIGISICALIEIGVFWELIGMLILSLGVTALSYPAIKVTKEQLSAEDTWKSHLKTSTDLERLKLTLDSVGVKYDERECCFDKSLVELDIIEHLDEVYNSLKVYFTKEGKHYDKTENLKSSPVIRRAIK